MVYTIKNDTSSALVYDPRVPEAILLDPHLKQKDNTIGSLEFTMYPNHAEYGSIQKRRTIYAVYRDDATDPIFKGIALEGTDDLNTITGFYFEDFLSVFRDSMQDPFDFTGNPSEFLATVISAHNAQVEPWQRVTLGHITVQDPNEYVHWTSNTELSTWEVLQKRFIAYTGGHLRMRYPGGVATLDYLEGGTSSLDPYLNTSTQTISIGENLKSFSRLISAGETYTACIPKGAEITKYDDEGAAHSARLTIEDVNDGSKYLVDSAAVALYGFRCAPIEDTTWDDVTIASNLKAKGQLYLSGTGVKLKNTIKLSALDLYHLGVASGSYGFLDYIPVSLYPHGIEAVYLLTEIEIPLDDPSELAVTLGETSLTLSDLQNRTPANTQQKLEELEHALSNGQVQVGAEIAQTATELRSLIEQTSESIMTQVSRIYTSSSSFESFQSQVSTLLTQTATAFNLQFTTITSRISALDSSVSEQLTTIRKYIQFVDGNILLGEDGNPLVLKITNSKISFIYNKVEIAYFSSGRLYVDNLEALISLTLGAYAFIPDTAGGMALKYIGT